VPKIVDKQQKSEAISRAAMTVFRDLGFHNSRMADIAKAAGVGKGTLYEYFKDKSDVLRFAFDRYFESFKAGAARAMDSSDKPDTKLFDLIRFAFEHIAEWEDHCVVYVDYLGVDRASGQTISLGSIYGEMRTLLAGLIEQGQTAGTIRRDIDPHGAADALLAVYDGIVLHPTFSSDHCDAASVRTATLAIVARGLKPIGQGTG
jgi:AcrR family transcriptional regulator